MKISFLLYAQNTLLLKKKLFLFSLPEILHILLDIGDILFLDDGFTI